MLNIDERRRLARLHRYVEANNKVIRNIVLSDISETPAGKQALRNLQIANAKYIRSIIELTQKSRKVEKHA